MKTPTDKTSSHGEVAGLSPRETRRLDAMILVTSGLKDGDVEGVTASDLRLFAKAVCLLQTKRDMLEWQVRRRLGKREKRKWLISQGP